MYNPENYEARQAANERSKAHAYRMNEPWSASDDDAILEHWILGADRRDEAAIARALGRTIEACRNRAHHIRVILGEDQPTGTRTTTRITHTEIVVTKVTWDDDGGWESDWYVR